MPPTFFNASEGILPVEGLNITTTGGTDIHVTHDRGTTWNSTTLLPGDASATDFIDINHGWVTDGTMLYLTSDAGQHWTKIFSAARSMPKFQRLDFVSSKVGWAIGYTDAGAMFLLSTVDGGQMWMQVQYILYKVAIH